jgi:NADPH2:quinone reductase
MKAIRLHEFGPAENLVLDEVPDLSPSGGEVRIAVEAAGVHLLDTTLRTGDPGPFPASPALPTIPGREVAGVVDAGPAEWVGRRVVAHLGMVPGGYAEQAVTAVGNLFDLPEHVSFAAAVAMVGTGRTTMGILENNPIAADDVVLVPAAAGGIGWLLVQAAHAAGATVVAAARGEEKLARLEELKPDVLVDYSDPAWTAHVDPRPTVVFDGVGGALGRQSLELLAPGGRFVMFGYSAGEPTSLTTTDLLERSLSASWSLGPRMFARPGGIRALAQLALDKLAAGEWSPLVTTYPLGEAARAHRDLEERRTTGKVVLLP